MNLEIFLSDPKVVAAVVGAISAVIVSVLNNLLNSRRNKAEIEKFEAETAKIKAETEQIVAQTASKLKKETEKIVEETKQEIDNSVNYKVSNTEEVLIFGNTEMEAFDFKLNQAKCWKDNSAYGERASGDFQLIDNIVNVERANDHGRLELVLKKYLINGQVTDYIPKDITRGGDRKFHLSFKAKSTKGRQQIRVVAKDNQENKWLAQKKTHIENNDWIQVDAYLRVPNDKDFFIRIDNENPDQSPTSCQFSEIKLTERM